MEKIDNEKIKSKAIKKLTDEYFEFYNSLKNKSKSEILIKAYELVCKNEIKELYMYDDNKLSDYKAILKMKKPLDELYKVWLSFDDTIYMTMKENLHVYMTRNNKVNDRIER
ncbi:MAG: DUF3848 domain-containing protein [Bacilli bacterium]|nr:DUF3848 domain-containing protein [Bacilli bacterium]